MKTLNITTTSETGINWIAKVEFVELIQPTVKPFVGNIQYAACGTQAPGSGTVCGWSTMVRNLNPSQLIGYTNYTGESWRIRQYKSQNGGDWTIMDLSTGMVNNGGNLTGCPSSVTVAMTQTVPSGGYNGIVGSCLLEITKNNEWPAPPDVT